MRSFILFCKTYSGDFDRFKILKESIGKYNKDNIPFYCVCPQKDKNMFENLRTGNEEYEYNIITDEEVLKISNNEQSWFSQQLVKLNFYKLNIAENWLVLDSDCYFIRDFHLKDFMIDDNTPYIAFDEPFKGVLQLAELFFENDDSSKGLAKHLKITREYFGSNGKDLTILLPFVMSAKVVKGLEEYFLNKNMTFKDMLDITPFEMQWYVAYLLKFNPIKYSISNTFFFHIHYHTQYKIYQCLGFNEEIIARNYLGIIMNSGWVRENKFRENFLGRKIRKIIQKHYEKFKNKETEKIPPVKLTKRIRNKIKKFIVNFRCIFIFNKERRESKRKELMSK